MGLEDSVKEYKLDTERYVEDDTTHTFSQSLFWKFIQLCLVKAKERHREGEWREVGYPENSCCEEKQSLDG